MKTIDEFIKENKDKIFRVYKYKNIYTPYEKDKKFMDETIFENGGYPTYVSISEAIALPDNDILLELQIRDPDIEDKKVIEDYFYMKLSEIKLDKYKSDQIEIDEEQDIE